LSGKIFSALLRKRNRERSYDDAGVNRNCRELEVNNWIISEFVIRDLVPLAGYHPFPLNEMMLMVAAVCWFRPTHICEWGTHIGKSARIFYEAARRFETNSQVHSIDLPWDVRHIEHPREQRGKLVKGIPDVILHEGDGLTTSMEVLAALPGPLRPLFFLDGDHSYDSVKRELEGIITGCPGSAILVHDTFYQSEESGYNIGPYKAIEDVVDRGEGFSRIDTSTGLPGMTLIYRSDGRIG